MAEHGGPERLILTRGSRPRLPRHVKLREDAVRGRWILVAPERVLSPDASAIDVLGLCDGSLTIDEIAAELARSYDTGPDVIAADALSMLQDLADKGVVTA